MVTNLSFGNLNFDTDIRNKLAKVEKLMFEEISKSDIFMTEAVEHLFKAGGKRFRPLFILLAASLGPKPSNPQIVVSSAVIELVHLATLYHDDVMDEAQIRRGTNSANVRWNNNIAILTGDYLFATASRLVSLLGVDAVRMIANAFAQLVTGQMRETYGFVKNKNKVDHYFKVVYEKTACLIAASGWFAGTFSNADNEQVSRLYRLGGMLGMAFQISDDIIDLNSNVINLGKNPYADLRKGVYTLPILFALNEEGLNADRLRELLIGPIKCDKDINEALILLKHSSGITRTKNIVANYVNQALKELAYLPSKPGRDALVTLLEYTVERNY